jgi:hypothetical protein
MSNQRKPEEQSDMPKFKPRLPEGWEQLELPMDGGHIRVITRKTQPR